MDPAKLGEETSSVDRELRRRAEGFLRGEASSMEPSTALEASALLHELRVHQIELEMQNEELRRAQEELGDSRAKYFELFDLAPVGYVTLDDNGTIREANLTAAGLLGAERERLAGKPLGTFIFAEDQDLLYRCHKLAAEGEHQVCEPRRAAAGAPRGPRSKSSASARSGSCPPRRARREADARQLVDESRRPAVDVVLPYPAAQPRHAQGLIVGSHLDSRADGLRELVSIVRIDDQGVAQFPRGAREAA